MLRLELSVYTADRVIDPSLYMDDYEPSPVWRTINDEVWHPLRLWIDMITSGIAGFEAYPDIEEVLV